MPCTDPGGLTLNTAKDWGGYYSWGHYNFEIARDGSYGEVVPIREANGEMWGYHMNVVKLLEVSPCTNCVTLSNIHVLINGDVSVDISIRHPYYDRRYTGFDVRGIIMFPASQTYPDDNIRNLIDFLDPIGEEWWKVRIANHEYGDAELMNPDGWTVAWSSEEGPIAWDYGWYQEHKPEDLPIFRYYPGKIASGENLSTLSGFIRYHSTEIRHMFEVGKTVTHTYVIRPPESGPIEASYAIYAHWYPADNIPVVDPAVDFPPEANSPLPYEFYVTQDAPLDPDAPDEVIDESVQWHIKTWSIGNDYWKATAADLGYECSSGYVAYNHPNGEPDEYMVTADYICLYPLIENGVPGIWPILCNLGIYNPKDSNPMSYIGQDTYIMDFEYAALDGQW